MPAVFVHGVPETPAIWDDLRSHLGRDDVIALQLPGFGCPRPAGFGATKEEYVDWLVGELEPIAAHGPDRSRRARLGRRLHRAAREHARRPRSLVGDRHGRPRQRRLRVARLRQDLADARRGRGVLRAVARAVARRAGRRCSRRCSACRSTRPSISTAGSTRRWSTASWRCTDRRSTVGKEWAPDFHDIAAPGRVLIPSDDAFLDADHRRAPARRTPARRSPSSTVSATGGCCRIRRVARQRLGSSGRRSTDARRSEGSRSRRPTGSAPAATRSRSRSPSGWRDRSFAGRRRTAVPSTNTATFVAGAAVVLHALVVEPHTPLGEELTERVVLHGRRLGVDHTADVVGVERRDARLVARRVDAAVRRSRRGVSKRVDTRDRGC